MALWITAWSLGMLLAAVPVSASVPGERLLLCPPLSYNDFIRLAGKADIIVFSQKEGRVFVSLAP